MSSDQQKTQELLSKIAELMKLADENPFKVRAFENAAHVVSDISDLYSRAKAGTLTEIKGIGKGISEVLTEFLLKGRCSVLEELEKQIPEGLLVLTQVPGLGAKKAKLLMDELGVQSLAELEYACRENRLLKLKGFGEKLQKKILEGIEFLKSTAGKARISDALPAAQAIAEYLEVKTKFKIEQTGALRRRLEVIERLDFLVLAPESKRQMVEKPLKEFQKKNPELLPVYLHFAEAKIWGTESVLQSATIEHLKALEKNSKQKSQNIIAESEQDFYNAHKIEWIAPEMRETGEEVALAKDGKLKNVLGMDDIQGVFHNHTTRSDGAATLEEMVKEAVRLRYKYIGISDHSQSAFYAHGLKKDALFEQEKEIKKIQNKYPQIKIFWGIESDILQDGSLDYDAKILSKFDFVIASIHSRFQMDQAQMTDRILKAIRNPHTRMIGHITGRLLLGREGYALNMEKIIIEAAKHDVAIEINAHPARLDIDWRWGKQLRAAGTKVSINPDAHDLAGLQDTAYGVTVARKALLPRGLVINSWPLKEVEKWLQRSE